MHFSTKNPFALISLLRSKKIAIYTLQDPISILTTEIFRIILEKECINYEILIDQNPFENDQFKLFIDQIPKKNIQGILIGIGAKKLIQKQKKEELSSIEHKNQDFKMTKTDLVDPKVCKNLIMTNQVENDLKLWDEENNANSKIISYLVCEYNSCICDDHIYSIQTAYCLLKSLNYKERSTIWPLMIYFSYSENFKLHKIKCEVCEEIIREIQFDVKKLNSNENTDNNILLYKEGINIPFLSSDNLLSTLNYNISFLLKKKFINKFKSEMKVFEFLAKSGISIQMAKESFKNLSEKQKNLIIESFPKTNIFSRKFDNDVQISGVEGYFIIVSYLCKNQPFLALQSLQHKQYTNLNNFVDEKSKINMNLKKRFKIKSDKQKNIYFELMHALKKNIKNIKQFNRIKILFMKIKNLSFIKELYNMFEYFLNRLNFKSLFFIIVHNYENEKTLVYGKKLFIQTVQIDSFGMANILNEIQIKNFFKKCQEY